MSIKYKLHINRDELNNVKEPELHSMPCKIHADEEANVDNFFKPYIKKIDDEHLKSSFRGRPLQGKKIVLPDGYVGITFHERNKPIFENIVNRDFYATAKFKEFTYWNYDKLPSKNDPLIGAIDWIDIAEALHSTKDDSET